MDKHQNIYVRDTFFQINIVLQAAVAPRMRERYNIQIYFYFY